MSPVSLESFLDAFFGAENDLSLPAQWRQTPQFRPFLPFVEDLEKETRRPLLLPREHGGNSLLYACAWDAAQGRRLSEALRAFIGPTWSDFDGVPVKPRTGDSVEQALASLGPATIYRMRLDGARRSEAWHAAALLRDVWLAAPERLVEEQVPLGRLLRDLDLALAAHDAQLSALLIEKIEQSRELQPANVAFLKIRWMRAMGDAEGLLRLPGLDELLNLRLPLAVRDAVLAAGHEVHLAQNKVAGDLAGAVANAESHLGFMRRLLDDVRVPPTEAGLDALLALLLAEARAGRPRVTPVLDDGNLTAWQRSLLAGIRSQVTPTAQDQDPTAMVQAALAEGQPAEAWAVLDLVKNQQARLQFAVQCALSLKDPTVTRTVAEELASIDESLRRAVLSPPWFSEVWQAHVVALPSTSPAPTGSTGALPVNWLELLQMLLEGSIDDAEGVVADRAVGWPPVGRMDHQVNALLLQFDPSSAAFADLTNVLPRLLESINEVQLAPRTAATCVTLFALNEELTPAAVRALLEALRLAVVSAPTDYADLLDVVTAVLPRAVSVPAADWFLDLVDYLLAAPAASVDARQAFCTQVLTRLHVLARRLQPAQRLLGDLLCRDVGLVLDWAPSGDQATTTEDRAATAARGTVLLYSLQTAALARVKKALQGLSEHLTVHVSEEHDGSPRLKSQVQNSDVLVLATRRATHAATGFIEQWRRRDSVLVYAPGAGSASMLASAWSALTGR